MDIFQLGPDLERRADLTGKEPHVIILRPGENCEYLERCDVTDLASRKPEDISFCKAETHHMYIEGNLYIPPEVISGSEPVRVMFFLTKDALAFVDSGSLTRRVLSRARQNPKDLVQSREKLLYDYFALLMEGDAAMLRGIESRILALEEEIYTGETEDYRAQTLALRRRLLILREYYTGLSDLAEELEENENGVCDEENLTYFGIITGRADRLLDRTERLVEYLTQVQNANNELIAEQQNRNMNYLSVISSIFLPLTLITGWFGMNFNNMPELENGYPFVIAGSVIIVIAVILLFKKKKFL